MNCHLRALEAAQLVEAAEERQWGGITERLMVATASSHVVLPGTLGAIAAKPENVADCSRRATSSRSPREPCAKWATSGRRVRRSNKRLAPLSLDTIIPL